MTKTVVVAGRGITGAFVAYFLSGLDAEVIVVDPGDHAGRASVNNPGGVNPLHGPGIPGLMSEFAMDSYRLHLAEWTNIANTSQIAFYGRIVTRVFVAFTEDEACQLKQIMQLYDKTEGFVSEWLDGDALSKLDSRISNDAIGALWTQGNASVGSDAYVNAVMKAACARGAVDKRGRVSGIEASDGIVRSVVVDSESLSCDEVVYATGAWVQTINSTYNIALPVRPVRGQLLLAELASETSDHDISWSHYGIYHDRGRHYWLGGTFEESGFDDSPTDSGKRTILQGVSRIVPELKHSRVLRHTAGLRPMTPDGLPIIDRVPGYGNAWLALGGGSKGMLLSSGLGKVAAELAVGGVRDAAPACLSLARFGATHAVSSSNTGNDHPLRSA